MNKDTPNHLQTIDHYVGNNIGHARLFHLQKGLQSQDRLREIQRTVTEMLETYIQEQSIDDQGVLNVLQALKEYDWTTREGYIAFRQVHDAYQRANGEAVFPLF